MKKYEIRARVLEMERLNNSIYGGPRCEVFLHVLGGDFQIREFYAKTASNSAAGWQLSGSSVEDLRKKELTLEIHVTRSGSIVINRVVAGYYEN